MVATESARKNIPVVLSHTREQFQTSVAGNILGINQGALKLLAKNMLGEEPKGSDSAVLWALRGLSRDDAAKELKKIPKGKLGKTSIKSILDNLFSLPRVVVMQAQIRHDIDKESRKSQGILSFQLEVDRPVGQTKIRNDDDFLSCVIVVGSSERRLFLAHSEVSIPRSNKKTLIEKEIPFDWEKAKADAAGEGGEALVHVRLLLDSVRGMDIEMQLKLE